MKSPSRGSWVLAFSLCGVGCSGADDAVVGDGGPTPDAGVTYDASAPDVAGPDGAASDADLPPVTPPATPPIDCTKTQCRYVTPPGAGAKSGADWANACAGFTGSCTVASLARGTTYFVAGGTYQGSNFNTQPSGSLAITIRKAVPSDHGTDTGWNAAFGTSQAVFSSMVEFNSSFWMFDGQTGGGPGAWSTGFGFAITSVADGASVVRIGYVNHTASDITIRHVDMAGKGASSTSGGGTSNDGVAIYGPSKITVAYAYLHGIGRCPIFASTKDTVFEDLYVERYYGSSAVHSEVASLWAFGGSPTGDITFRNSLVTHIASTGGLMFDNVSNPASHLYVYGNVFFKPPSATWDKANGLIGGWTGANGEEMHNVWVFHNTFVNVDQQSLSSLPQVATGGRAQNNLWVTSNAPSFADFPTHDYNLFVSSGTVQGEANGATAQSSPLKNPSALDFTLSANTPPGVKLGAPYDVDPLGKPRTTATRGAYEF